jgi:hypothetical protein
MLTTIKIRKQDLRRIKRLSVIKPEPRWSVIKRALDKLEVKQ